MCMRVLPEGDVGRASSVRLRHPLSPAKCAGGLAILEQGARLLSADPVFDFGSQALVLL